MHRLVDIALGVEHRTWGQHPLCGSLPAWQKGFNRTVHPLSRHNSEWEVSLVTDKLFNDSHRYLCTVRWIPQSGHPTLYHFHAGPRTLYVLKNLPFLKQPENLHTANILDISHESSFYMWGGS